MYYTLPCRSGAAGSDMEALYRRALQAGLQGAEDYMDVLLARLDCLRYNLAAAKDQGHGAAGAGAGTVSALREAFKEALELMMSYFPGFTDT